MASGLYNGFKTELAKGNINFSGDIFKVALMDENFVFVATETVFDSEHEIIGTGYTPGGVTLTSPVVSGTTSVKCSAGNAVWSASTFTAYFAIIYDSSNSNKMIACIDLGGAKMVTSGTFTIVWDGTVGILTIE